MPCSVSSRHKGVEVGFEEEGHVYTAKLPEGDVRLDSVTEFIHSYAPVFESERMAGICARKEGISKEEMLRRWEEKRDHSCVYGTMIHETLEDRLLGRDLRHRMEEFREGAERRTFASTSLAARDVTEKLDIISVEKMVFSLKYRLAGTVDLLCRPKKRTDMVLIQDWKTNSTLDIENRYSKVMKPPISSVPASSWGIYTLQLSLYQLLLEEEGYFPSGMKYARSLCWLHDGIREWLKVPDMTKEVKLILADRLRAKP